MSVNEQRLEMADVRKRLEGERGRELWRSLDELAQTEEFDELLHREFSREAASWPEGVDRRRFLQVMGASLALGGLTACTKQPPERIVPYINQPEILVPGKPLYFATNFVRNGFSTGLLAESHMGRPTKVEGNPEHPAGTGATDLFAQASILGLYDPDRSQVVRQLGRIRTWSAFFDETLKAFRALSALGGARLRILTETVTSPTLAGMIRQVLAEYPKAAWHQYDPAGRHSARAGAEASFGEQVETLYDLSRAEIVVALDADFLTEGPGSLRYARDFARLRRLGNGKSSMSRLYAAESAPTATGTLADNRLPVRASEIAGLAAALASGLGVEGTAGAPTLEGGKSAWVAAAAADLAEYSGRSVVIPGEHAEPAVHVLCHAINASLGNVGSTVSYVEPVEAEPADQLASISQLAADMNAGEVDVLLILGGNPVYDAPAELEFGQAMLKVGRRIRLSLYEDETSELCQWHLPEAHYLESWGDARAFDGTVGLVQPLIEPLYDGKSAIELLSGITEAGERPGYDLVREQWGAAASDEEAANGWEADWRRWLHDGFIADSASAPTSATPGRGATAQAVSAAASSGGLDLVFRPDPTVWDGRYANNGWLQECPKPLTKLTWDNAAMISPALAERLGVANEQMIDLTVDGRTLAVATWIQPGVPDETVVLHLGYGRTRVGQVGQDTGFNAYALRTASTPWLATGAAFTAKAESYSLASTQMHMNIELEGPEAEKRHLVRTTTLGEYEKHPDFAQHVGHHEGPLRSILPEWEYNGYAWGLTVDLGSCTGCNACVIACQAENNVPVVGKDQVELGREMHWIRIDRYYMGSLDEPATHHQPVMCMHCEKAPCEVVCPVAATVHSSEGLNDMVYNRCVGTRYCANNCPYKVRRFNFLLYNDFETPVLQGMRNPDVTVRSRGVMEKCSYCVQRISQARIEAKKERRKIRDGEVVTACQQACPTEAIVFGDTNDPDSAVARSKAGPLNYGILEELNTTPRTTYLAKVTNPSDAEGLSSHAPADGHGGGSHEGDDHVG
jgi:molybdopterin-containing oxidoreductase family iron-sulfur binding subunit